MSELPITVLMTVRDGAKYLGPAVASVLNQTLQDVQFVIVDDASEDRTPDLLASIRDTRVEVHRSDIPLGIASAKLLGLSYAVGKYVAMMDADDISLPWRLSVQKAYLDATPDVGIVGSNVVKTDLEGRRRGVRLLPSEPLATRWRLFIGPPFIHPAVMIRREILALHSYRDEFSYAQDYDLWARLLRVTRGANITQPLLLYRSHPGQHTQDSREAMLVEHDTIATRIIGEELPSLDFSLPLISRMWRFMTGVNADDAGLNEIGLAYLQIARSFLATHRGCEGRGDVLEDLAFDVTRRFTPHLRRAAGRAVLRELTMMDPLAPVRCAAAVASAAALRFRSSSTAHRTRRHVPPVTAACPW